MMYKLKKSSYNLKQVSKQQYKKFDNFMGNNGFLRCQANHCYYMKKNKNSYSILFLYVNDMLIKRPCIEEIIELKKLSQKNFMKNLKAIKQILEIRITKIMVL